MATREFDLAVMRDREAMLRPKKVSGSFFVGRGNAPLPATLLTAILFSAVGVTSPDLASAIHATMMEEPEQDVEHSDKAPDVSSDGTSTVITGEVVESHDLLSEADGSSRPVSVGIEWSHKFTVTLSGRNHVVEKWSNVRVAVGSRSGIRSSDP